MNTPTRTITTTKRAYLPVLTISEILVIRSRIAYLSTALCTVIELHKSNDDTI